MKQLTLSDFIKYNNPCFGCGHPCSFKLAYVEKGARSTIGPGSHKIFLDKDGLEVNLKVTYKNTLKLKIFYKNNKFIYTDLQGLTGYLEKYNLWIESECSHCHSYIKSQNLSFNLDKNFLLPIQVDLEIIFVFDDKINRKYVMYSYHQTKKSNIIIDDFKNHHVTKSLEMEIPLVTIFSLKNKQKFLEKINTILLFS